MYIVTYKGPFGFIKPWTAVRDGETFSQQFLYTFYNRRYREKAISRIIEYPWDTQDR